MKIYEVSKDWHLDRGLTVNNQFSTEYQYPFPIAYSHALQLRLHMSRDIQEEYATPEVKRIFEGDIICTKGKHCMIIPEREYNKNCALVFISVDAVTFNDVYINKEVISCPHKRKLVKNRVCECGNKNIDINKFPSILKTQGILNVDEYNNNKDTYNFYHGDNGGEVIRYESIKLGDKTPMYSVFDFVTYAIRIVPGGHFYIKNMKLTWTGEAFVKEEILEEAI